MNLRRNMTTLGIVALLVFQIAVLVVVNLPGPASAAAKYTPIPTLIPATMPAPAAQVRQASLATGECAVTALDLLGAWAQAGASDTQDFPFKDQAGKNCVGNFKSDIQPLFLEPNIWYAGAIPCATCHGENVEVSAARMNLSSYEGIMAGSRRADNNTKGDSILTSPDGWEKSRLYIQIFTRQMPMGRPANSPQKGPTIMVGKVQP